MKIDELIEFSKKLKDNMNKHPLSYLEQEFILNDIALATLQASKDRFVMMPKECINTVVIDGLEFTMARPQTDLDKILGELE